MPITLKSLLSLPLFESFEEEPRKLSYLMRHGEILRYAPGLKVLSEGEQGDGALFLVYEGSVGIAKLVDPENKRAKNLGIIRTGDFFGEMSLLEAAPYSATVFTLEETTLVKITARAFSELAATDTRLSSSLLFSLIRAISDRLRKTNTEVVILYETGKILSSIAELNAMARALLDRVCGSLRIPYGALVVYNELSGQYELAASIGEDFDFSDDLNHELIRELKTNGRGFRFPLDDLGVELLDRLSKSQFCSVMAVPLLRYEKVYGAMVLAHPKETSTASATEFSDFEYNLVLGVAQQASFAVENARNREEEAARQAYSRRSKKI